MNRLARLSLLIVTFTMHGAAYCQQRPVVSQYRENPVFLNPGATAADGKSQVQLLHRSQWAGYNTYDDASGAAPELQLLTAAMRLKTHIHIVDSVDSTVVTRIKPGRHGVGAVIMRDRAASLTTLEATLSYAYHLPFTKKSTLALGVQAGIQNQTIDYDRFRVKHAGDPLLPEKGKEAQARPALSLGLWYEHEKYYLGWAIDGISGSALDDLGVNTNRNWTFTAGYHLVDEAGGWRVSPSLLALSNSDEYLLGGGVHAVYQDICWGGLTYRHKEAVSAMLGMGLLEQRRLYVSYALDYVTSNASAKARTSHEIMIGYRWE